MGTLRQWPGRFGAWSRPWEASNHGGRRGDASRYGAALSRPAAHQRARPVSGRPSSGDVGRRCRATGLLRIGGGLV